MNDRNVQAKSELGGIIPSRHDVNHGAIQIQPVEDGGSESAAIEPDIVVWSELLGDRERKTGFRMASCGIGIVNGAQVASAGANRKTDCGKATEDVGSHPALRPILSAHEEGV